jgi:YD repeat-containing protein
MDRMTSQTYTSTHVASNTSDAYTYDLASNRITDTNTGSTGTVTVTTYTYDADDQMTQVASPNGFGGTAIGTYTYDPNGSMTGGGYAYDVRNKLVGVGSTTYLYDDAGNLVSETAGGITTTYLLDTQNPTGYTQPIETKTSNPTAVLPYTYILGDHVLA